MIVPGKNPVIELLKSNWDVDKLLVTNGHSDPKISEAITLAAQRKIEIEEVNEKYLDKLYDRHQGIIAETKYNFQKLPEQIPFGYFLYIRESQDLGNIGAIVRTAEAAKINGVILPTNAKIHPTIARTSMGAIFHLPIYQGSLFPTIKHFKQEGFQVAAIEIDGTQDIFAGNFNTPTLMIVGGEDHSVSPEVQSKCDHVFKIPQFGSVNSLNMSVAAAIAIYEHVRQSG